MAVWAVGDVQGCLEPLESLLQRIAFDPAADTVWFCGDLVNRGPDSLGVLTRVQELGAAAVTVLGNHDLHWLAGHLGSEDSDIRAKADWLRRQPLAHYDEVLDCLMTHAGVYPGWDLEQTLARAREVEQALRGPGCEAFLGDMYGDAPNRWSDDLNGTRRLRTIVNALTRMRMVDERGAHGLRVQGPARRATALLGALVRSSLAATAAQPGRVRALVGARTLPDGPPGSAGFGLCLGRGAERRAPGWSSPNGADALLGHAPRKATRRGLIRQAVPTGPRIAPRKPALRAAQEKFRRL